MITSRNGMGNRAMGIIAGLGVDPTTVGRNTPMSFVSPNTQNIPTTATGGLPTMPAVSTAPAPAPVPAMAQQPAPERSMLDRFRDYMSDDENRARMALAFNSMRFQPDAQLAQMLGSEIKDARASRQANKSSQKTIAELRRRGRRDLANAVESGMLDPVSAAKLLFAQPKDDSTALQRNYEYAKTQGYKGSFEDFLNVRKSGTTVQIGGDTRTAKPEAGTQIITDEGGISKQVPIFGSPAAEQVRSSISTAERSLKAINDTLADTKGLQAAVGPFDGRSPDVFEDATRFATRHNQLTGQAFLQAFESLKGGGQITQIEGDKATQAIQRLNRTMSEEDYKEALNELKEIVERGLKRAKEQWSQIPKPEGIEDKQDPLGIR